MGAASIRHRSEKSRGEDFVYTDVLELPFFYISGEAILIIDIDIDINARALQDDAMPLLETDVITGPCSCI